MAAHLVMLSCRRLRHNERNGEPATTLVQEMLGEIPEIREIVDRHGLLVAIGLLDKWAAARVPSAG
ncbi:hypothetical protein AB4144_00160 [Rhizobiaceae sp. 2RAB30]